MEVLLYILAAIGVVGLAYYFGGKKYAVGAGAFALGVLYLVFGKQNNWTDAWKKADEKLKGESDKIDERKDEFKEDKEKTEDKIEDSKERADEIRDKIDDVEDSENVSDEDAEELKDWVESFNE